MKIDFMRKVDYWGGIPLTTIVTIWCRMTDRVNSKIPLAKVKRVLFIELSEMGSAIIVDPALKKMAAQHEIFFVIFKRNAVSLRIFNTVPAEKVFTVRDDSFFTLFWDTLRLFVWCRRRKIEAVIDLELFSRFTALLSGLSGAPVRLGFFNPRSEGLYRGRILTHPVFYNPHIHIAKNFISLCEPLLHPESYADPLNRRKISDEEISLTCVTPEPSAVNRVHEIIKRRVPDFVNEKKIILVNVNAGDFLPQRKWPKSHFSEFVRMLLKQNPQLLVLLTGSPKERPEVEEVALAVSSSRCVNIAGDLQFEDLPALYYISQALLTNDSGPAHFASAVGLRTYVLFGPETPELYRPLNNAVSIYAGLACSPCVTATNHRNTPCNDNQCLKTISPQLVFEKVQSYLDQGLAIKTGASQSLV